MAGLSSDSSSNDDNKNDNNKNLKRTSSQLSTASRKSGTLRAGSRKHSLVTPTSAKTLESFPSLSPEASPGLKSPKQFVASPLPQSPSATPFLSSSKNSPSIVRSLITSKPSFSGRSGLFDDAPNESKQNIPGALHRAKDSDIKRLIDKNGAIALVRRLSEDVAQRDAEITAFRRRAEERERELKKMLREVEVSNLDIEARLHRLSNSAKGSITLQDPPTKGGTVRGGVRDGKARVPAVPDGIDEMMGEALKDDVGRISADIDEGYLDSLERIDKQATVKTRSVNSKGSDGRSMASSRDSQSRPSSTIRGWKEYLWSRNGTSGKNSRASSVVSDYNEEIQSTLRARGLSGNNSGRKRLDEHLFQPLGRASTMQTPSVNQSRKSSSSAASWSLAKLFGGNPQANRDPVKQNTVRGRSATTGSSQGKSSEALSTTSGPSPTSAQAALMKVKIMESSTNLRAARKGAQPLTLGSSSTNKTSSQPSGPQMPTSSRSTDDATNLGPVEMDTIHPHDSKPPTLAQFQNMTGGSSELLTDRFGFIYDQRRRKKAAEASHRHTRGKSTASANVEMIGNNRDSLKLADSDQMSQRSKQSSIPRPDTPASIDSKSEEKPTKRWQDYLKVATFPTELLSHTPSAKATTTVTSSDNSSPQLKRAPTGGDSRVSLPSTSLNPDPEISPITAGNAEMAQSALSPASAQATEDEPVKLLLSQLTDLHDTLQREKTIKWNEFLRKVRADRKKEGETADPRSNSKPPTMPEATLADGEIIGVAGLGNKGKVGRAKWKEFKHLVLAGIPVAYRAKIWSECSGASALRVPGYYDDLVGDGGNDDPDIVAQIQMDVHRTLTDNVFFRLGPGVAKLTQVLLAYSRRNPEVGYCQGMNLIAASLLLIVPTAEDAFWVLTSMIENILPQHYYDHSLLASRADQIVLRQYVTSLLPRLSAHLSALNIDLSALTFQWFLSVFTDCLSAEALFRVWDVVLCFNDGSTFLFQVALALLKLNEGQLLEMGSAAGVYGYIGNEMTDHAISIDGLVGASDALKGVVRRGEVEGRRAEAVERERGGRAGGEEGGEGSKRSSVSGGELSVQEPRPFES